MNTREPTSNQIQKQGQVLQPISQHELAVQTAIDLINTKKILGLSMSVMDKDFHKISGKFENMTNLLNNPEFISKLSQEFYISTNNDITWFKSKLRNGKLVDISFLLTLRINWIKMINKVHYSCDFIVVGYSPGDKGTEDFTTAIPQSDVTPEKIVYHFPQLIGQSANNMKEIGKLICYILSQLITDPKKNTLEYYGNKQGFVKNLKGQIQFNPAKMLPVQILPYMPIGLTSRQFPNSIERV